MKASFIIGSPNPRGNTALLAHNITNGIITNQIEVITHNLGELQINYCKGCKQCHHTRQCVQRDDMDKIFSDIFESELVLIASPVYWGNIPGQLKVFMDRCLPLCNALTGITPVPEGKYGFIVALSSNPEKDENQSTIAMVSHLFSHLGITVKKSFTKEGIFISDDYTEQDMQDAYEFGKNIMD